MIRYLLIICFLFGCASNKRTPYQAFDKKTGGYRDKSLDESLRIVNFKANSHTKKNIAKRFAEFRAIEVCKSEGFRLAHFLDSSDKSESKTVTRTYGGYPSYYYGMSPFYSRYSGFGYGFGVSTFSGESYTETRQYPEVEVIFECANSVVAPKIELREVSPEEMKHLVKDLRGGLQVEKIPPDSPNKKALRSGDLLIRAGDERLQEMYQLLSLFRKSTNNVVYLEIMRDGKLKTGVPLKGVDVTSEIEKAQHEIIKKSCRYDEIKDKPLCE